MKIRIFIVRSIYFCQSAFTHNKHHSLAFTEQLVYINLACVRIEYVISLYQSSHLVNSLAIYNLVV